MAIRYFCSTCDTEVDEYCPAHPSATIDSIQVQPSIDENEYTGDKTMYEARIILDNGLAASRKFDEYIAMCQWLADNATAGIEAWNISNGVAVDQRELQEDIESYHVASASCLEERG